MVSGTAVDNPLSRRPGADKMDRTEEKKMMMMMMMMSEGSENVHKASY